MKTLETTNRLRRTDYMLDHCDGLRLNKQYLGPDEEIRSHLPLVTTKVASVDACFSRLRKLNVQDGSPDFGVRHVHPGCQPPSDEGCCRDARSPGPRLTQGEVKTTPKASVTPHQQQPPTQPPQPRHTTLPRLRPRTWTWITPNAYLPRVCFGRRPAVRRKPHNPARGPLAVA